MEGVDAVTVDEHVRRLDAVLATLAPPVVVSHLSAAVLHGFDVDPLPLDRVWVTRPPGHRAPMRRHLVTRACQIERDETVLVDGRLVTIPERTVLDLAREFDFLPAVAVADSALRHGADRQLMSDLVERGARRRGNAKAKSVLATADGRSRGAASSMMRVLLVRHGCPPPDLDAALTDAQGRPVGRFDFLWSREHVVGQVDDTTTGEPGRIARVRSCGFELVRFGSRDIERPEAAAARTLRCLARGRARWGRADYRPSR
ncbi:type IV toxin-antitoxin system AbiEi family antitoxin domain-containing protein [Acidipropionibacterium timonense]|uniref:type IV toxin-antitoxin system AbiEi family antitoxin domain-containing protein n=1 Tax=Acidipropionibacterium timonense TaxID=2161818 RepID=UPI00102F9073|nr:hypothetical protein [Acidipropionibacterium timonense]